MADDYDEDPALAVPPAPPPKDINIFDVNEYIGKFAYEIFNGDLGELPMMLSVNVGYDPFDPEPFMYHYESQELLYAFKKDAQKRVLIKDVKSRTLSLPLRSSFPFCVGTDPKEVTMEQIVSNHSLPVSVRFARADSMDVTLDQRAIDVRYFGDFITVVAVYEEPFYWCLAIEANGKMKYQELKPIVLPRNLYGVGFSPVVAVRKVSDGEAVLQGYLAKYSQLASQVNLAEDPFFQELAFVKRTSDPVDPDNMQPYIDEHTFIPISLQRRPAPEAPSSGEPPPRLPPRNPHPQEKERGKEGRQGVGNNDSNSDPYTTLTPANDLDGHVYDKIANLDMNPKTRSHQEATTIRDPKEKLLPVPGERKPPPPKADPERCSNNLMSPPGLPPRPSHSQLKSMSVEGVAEVLKQLGLGKYAKKFQKNCIDGLLLSKLAERDLQSEFGLSHLEWLKLQTFITEGHIPKTKSKKS